MNTFTYPKLAAVSSWIAAVTAVVSAFVLVACGGGASDSGGGTSLIDGYGPGNPSGCPAAQVDDVWLDRRLGCLATGQLLFRAATAASGEAADRAYVVGQQVLDNRFANVLGPNRLRHFKYALCVQAAPSSLAPTTAVGDLEVALGLNGLATGTAFLPRGLSGSVLLYGSLPDVNTLVTPCDPVRHPVIVSYATRRVTSVNAAALTNVQIIDR